MKKSRLFSLGFTVLLTVILCLSLSACGDTSSNGGAGITDDGLIWVKGEDGVHITGYFGIKEDLVIPASIQGAPVVAIGNDISVNNKMLKTVTIPDGITSIGDWAFPGCSSLTSVTIGNSVTTIGEYAFSSCSNLKDVYYTGTAEEWAQISIGSNNSDLTGATIHYNYAPEE